MSNDYIRVPPPNHKRTNCGPLGEACESAPSVGAGPASEPPECLCAEMVGYGYEEYDMECPAHGPVHGKTVTQEPDAERIEKRGWLGARGQFDMGDNDVGVESKEVAEHAELAAVACLSRLDMSEGDRGYWVKQLAEPIAAAINVALASSSARAEDLERELHQWEECGRTTLLAHGLIQRAESAEALVRETAQKWKLWTSGEEQVADDDTGLVKLLDRELAALLDKLKPAADQKEERREAQ